MDLIFVYATNVPHVFVPLIHTIVPENLLIIELVLTMKAGAYMLRRLG